MAARKQFLLRVDPDLWRELERWAADDLRSVNAQVEWLLRDAVRLRRGGGRAARTPGDASPGEAADRDERGDDASPGGVRHEGEADETAPDG